MNVWSARCTHEIRPGFTQGDAVKVLFALAFLAALLYLVILGTETHAMATFARMFCVISTAIFVGSATLGLAARSRI
jgi:hypothetical protein